MEFSVVKNPSQATGLNIPCREGLRERHFPPGNSVCLRKTFKCQKVQELRLVRNESVSYLGECEESVKLSAHVHFSPHGVIEQTQEVAT